MTFSATPGCRSQSSSHQNAFRQCERKRARQGRPNNYDQPGKPPINHGISSKHQLLTRAGISERALQAKDARIPFTKNAAFFELAAEATDDSNLGFEFAQSRDTGDAGLLGYVGLNSPTVKDALKNLSRHRHVMSGFNQRSKGGPAKRPATFDFGSKAEIARDLRAISAFRPKANIAVAEPQEWLVDRP